MQLNSIRWLVTIASVVLILFGISPGAIAQSSKRSLQWPFYDPNSTGAASTSCSFGNGELPSGVLSGINRLKSAYVTASEKTGVPWQLIAAVHYRESNNDPNSDLQAGNPIGGPYSQQSTTYAAYGYPKSMAESAEFAARYLIEKSKIGIVKKPINIPSPDPEAIKDTLYSYNGRAQVYAQQAAELGFNSELQPYEGSPYVMSLYDEVHSNMQIITKDGGGLDGTVDQRFGAFTVYLRLGGGVTGGACTGAVVGNLMETIKAYAWPVHHDPNYFEMTPAYRAAIVAAQAKGEYVGGGPSHPGVDCGGFVTRAMRDSGMDANYNAYQGPTTRQQDYMNDNPDKYLKLSNVTSTADLQPGDIAINSDHTYFFVGDAIPGWGGNAASASYSTKGTSWRTPMADDVSNITSYTWYRLKPGV